MQLALGVQLQEASLLSHYVPGRNVCALAHLISIAEQSALERQAYIWGSSGVGKTHLLQGVAQEFSDQHLPVMYYSFKNPCPPALLEGLENCAAVCFDDIDCIAGDRELEEAFFHCFNRLRTHDTVLVMSAKLPVNKIEWVLPDVQSRLNWGVTHALSTISDQDKEAIIQLRAKARGLSINNDIARFIVRRVSRDMHALDQALNQIDQASLTQKRRVTIPFVKQVLHL